MTEGEVVHAREPDRGVLHVMYALHALAPFTAWLLAIIAIIIGFVKRDDARGTYLDSHVTWLSRTFWWGLVWIVLSGVITFILVITVIGILIWWLPWTILFIWYLYRVIKGWVRLSEGKPAF